MKNATLKQMIEILREKGIGVHQVKSTNKEGMYKIHFANGYIGIYNEKDHSHRTIRGTKEMKLDRRNPKAKEIIDKAQNYYRGIGAEF